MSGILLCQRFYYFFASCGPHFRTRVNAQKDYYWLFSALKFVTEFNIFPISYLFLKY